MPKINRIRIANILYDGKYIMDEIYDSYNCENMLINLKNGSGKSVLVQLMMQPMNPCIKIHDRNMESYLYSKQPSFIFIEWKLDNVSVPTYFLTGIVMKKSSADESNTSKINYFTFTNRYTDACKFDIESVPFIVHNGRSVSFESYEKCRTIIRNNVKSGTDFDYFHPDNKDHYFEKLAENGIYSNEWKTIANCNETEGGISELFKNIKTSDKLFDEWILKTIVNNLRLGNNLHETFSALIEEIDSNDEILRSKEYYERFLNDVDGYIDNLNELMEGYDATEQHQQNIADIYYFLLNSSKSTDENTEHCKDELEQIKTQTEIIRYEKLSDDYYTALNLFENQKKITENAQIDLENAQNLYNEAEKRINILNATKLYGEYKKYKGKAEAKKITLAKLIGENDNSRYNDLVFSLNHVYSALINETESQLESLVKRNMEIDKRIKKLSLEKIEITKINNVLLTEKGKLSSKIDQFEKYEQNVFKELNISLARDFLGEYDKNDILKIQTDFENKKKLINDTINAKNSEIEKLSEKITSLNNEESTLTDEKHQLDIKCLEIKNIIAEFEKAKSKAVSALKFFNLSESELYNSEINLISIDFQEKKYKKRLDEFQRDYHAKETYRSAVNNGAVHTSPEFSAILDAHNIDYETGEKYLAEEKSDKQRELLLKVNPMLPFSYIVKEKDYQCIKKTVFSENVNKAVPIITFEDIQRNISHIPKIAELDEKSMFVCLYNKECIDEERKKLYLEKLNGEMKKIEKNIGELKSKLEELSLAKKDYLSFKYDSTFLPSKNSELNETKSHIISDDERINMIKSERDTATNNKNDLQFDIINLKEQFRMNNQNKQCFENYLSENEIFISNREKLSKTETDININDERLRKTESDITEINAEKSNNIENIRSKEETISNTKRKLSKLDNNTIGNMLKISIEQMEAEYESILNDKAQSRKAIESAIEEYEETATDRLKELNKLNVNSEEYEKILYNERIFEMAEKNKDEKEAELSKANNKYTTLEKELIIYDERFKATEKNLKDNDYNNPLEMSKIKKNFNERKKLLENREKIIVEKINNNEKFSQKCRNKYNQLYHSCDNLKKKHSFFTDNIDEINPTELIDTLNNHKRKTDKIYKKLQSTYNKVRSDYSNCEYEVITSFISNMTPENADSFEHTFPIYERVKDCCKYLQDELNLAKHNLENIENQKSIFIRQALEQGKKIFSEVRDMSNLSRVKLDGKNRQTLFIDIPEKPDPECENAMRIALQNFLISLREENFDAVNNKQLLRKKIEKTFSNRELLNIVIGKRHIPVKLYTVDATNGIGSLRKWEDVIVQNSGAQMFISAFAFISTLIDYERHRISESNGSNETFSKVFIIDNPFGKTSSKTFLDAMIAVSKKFKCQLICLSDLNQSSITNQFNVIYQLALKTPLYSNKSYLKIEKPIISGDVSKNSRLEHISMKTEQMTLF